MEKVKVKLTSKHSRGRVVTLRPRAAKNLVKYGLCEIVKDEPKKPVENKAKKPATNNKAKEKKK